MVRWLATSFKGNSNSCTEVRCHAGEGKCLDDSWKLSPEPGRKKVMKSLVVHKGSKGDERDIYL